MRIVAIGGMPATGKTTLVRTYLKTLGLGIDLKEGLVEWIQYERAKLCVLGRYRDGEIFGGTDRLSMAAQPEVLEWTFERAATLNVLFEGDRLFNVSFLAELAEHGLDLKVLLLTAHDVTLELRHRARRDSQTAGWLAGRRTKLSNVIAALRGYVEPIVLQHAKPEDTERGISILKSWIGG